MNVPMPVKLLGLVIGATLFYTWVGALVPQKEVHPPEVVELAEDVSTEELVSIGQTIYEGKGLCNTCHTIGQSGALRFPDLGGIAETAATRVPGWSAPRISGRSGKRSGRRRESFRCGAGGRWSQAPPVRASPWRSTR